jgi:hypothetical protein
VKPGLEDVIKTITDIYPNIDNKLLKMITEVYTKIKNTGFIVFQVKCSFINKPIRKV